MGPVRKFSSIVHIAVNFSLRRRRDNSVTITILHSYIMYNVHCRNVLPTRMLMSGIRNIKLNVVKTIADILVAWR